MKNQERMSLSAEVRSVRLIDFEAGLLHHLIRRVPVIHVEFLTPIRIYGDSAALKVETCCTVRGEFSKIDG